MVGTPRSYDLFLKGYELTGSKVCWGWFEKIHHYAWQHFRDKKRGGEVVWLFESFWRAIPSSKRGKWKGCFHVPRALFQLYEISKRLNI